MSQKRVGTPLPGQRHLGTVSPALRGPLPAAPHPAGPPRSARLSLALCGVQNQASLTTRAALVHGLQLPRGRLTAFAPAPSHPYYHIRDLLPLGLRRPCSSLAHQGSCPDHAESRTQSEMKWIHPSTSPLKLSSRAPFSASWPPWRPQERSN